jgi:hypothetical protein
MYKLKLGSFTVNVTFKGWPSSAELAGCETGNSIKLLAPDVRSKVRDEWVKNVTKTAPFPVIRPAVGANEKGLVCEVFMWEYRLMMALLAVQSKNVLPVAHVDNLSASVA